MEKINEAIIKDMKRHGWWDCSKSKHIYSYKRPELHQINEGNCENWALLAQSKFGGEAIWLTDDRGGDPCHCVLELKGRYYDSECLKGTENWRELPIFNRTRFLVDLDKGIKI